MTDLVLRPGRDRSVRRRHPWLLSGSVAEVEGEAAPGAEVRVLSADREVLGWGYFAPSSQIRVRLFAFGKEQPAGDWLERRVVEAVARRENHPLLADTDAVRLVNAEGDDLPGLVVDRYGDLVVVQLAAAGMMTRVEQVADALRQACGAPRGFLRPDAAVSRREGVPLRQGALWGDEPGEPVAIEERGRHYRVDVKVGQKTGFYLDQRDSRDLVQRLAHGRRVLDLFSYTGGFAVAAIRGGARSVTLVDSSAKALDAAREHVAAAGATEARFVQADAFQFPRDDTGEYDLLVIDPPPLARKRRDVEKATRAYKDAILFGLRRAAPGARLLVFACSHHVDADLFRKVAFGAALDAGRAVRVLATLGQPADHPVSLYHPEGEYLTGLLLEA